MSRPPLPEAVVRSGILDGGLSTQLERRGADVAGPLWTARLLREEPALIARAHRDFVDAGAGTVITASYQVSRHGLIEQGATQEEADAALRSSVAVARDSGAVVAASVGPYGAVLHDGSEYRGRYGVGHRALVDFHRERLDVLVDAQPDVLAIETIPDLDEVVALVEAIDDYPGIPAWLTVSIGADGNLCAGQSLTELAQVAAAHVSALGINCSAPSAATAGILALREATELPLVVYPNAGGVWDARSGRWEGAGEWTFADVQRWRAAGAVLVGGCCGVDAAGIRELAESGA